MTDEREHRSRRHGVRNQRDEQAAKDGAQQTGEQETDSIASLRGQLEEERNRAQGYFQSWQRAAADLQNYRRRTEEERQKNAMYANVALVMNILPLYDDLQRALEHVDESIAGTSWVDGIRQIARKFQGALEASGLREIAAEGQDFDPNLHEAVAQVDGEPGKVVNVVQRGYTMGDRVIRPALVTVGRHD